MTECEEVALSIWLNLEEPVNSYADAERIAARELGDESQTVKSNVAEALWELEQGRAGR